MEKGALLPLRFYPSRDWIDYEKTKSYSGKPGVVVFKDHHIMAPAFQMVMPDTAMHWCIQDFQPIAGPPPPADGEFTLRQYDDTPGAFNMWSHATEEQYGLFVKAGDHRNFVWNRFPLYNNATPPVGLWYYRFFDGRETFWYSDLIEFCDLGTNALTEAFTDDGGWATITPIYTAAKEEAQTDVCKTGGAIAEAYTPIEVFLGEELDLYLYGRDYTPACGAADWNDPIYFELRTEEGLVVSETVVISSAVGVRGTLTAQAGGSVRLYMYVLAADTTAADVHIWVQRRYSPGNVQVRWSNPKSLCKIFYEGVNDYENVLFIDSKQVIDENTIDETVVEDDQTNKYRIIGTNKKWNSLQFAGGEAMLNAMSLMRLHENIKIIKETGEVMDVDELLIEQSVLNFEASLIKLVYREDSCSVEACGFDPCCPTPNTPSMEDVFSGPGALPAAAAANEDDYAMVLTAADEYDIYLSNGAAWAVNADFDNADDCVEARQNTHTDGNRFFWYDNAIGVWRIFIELDSVADNTDGTANLVTDTEYRDGLTVQGEYNGGAYSVDVEDIWVKCTDPVDLVAGGGAITLVCACGAGTFDFRLHIYTDFCDYGYSNIIEDETIT